LLRNAGQLLGLGHGHQRTQFCVLCSFALPAARAMPHPDVDVPPFHEPALILDLLLDGFI
jgi:hypothetical protein